MAVTAADGGPGAVEGGLYGGAGNDWIEGGAGNDAIYGGDGDDAIYDGAINPSPDDISDDLFYGGLATTR